MTTYSSSATESLSIGSPVFTADGDEIGRVKELRGRYFKVDAPMRPDYWLSRETVGAIAGGSVTLAVDKEHLGDVKVKHPDDHMADEHDVAQHADMPRDTVAREGLLTAYPPNTPIGSAEHDVPVVGEAPAGASTWTAVSPSFRDTWTQRYGSTGRSWEQDEPAFRYGWEMATYERYAALDWPDAESDLGLGYSDWSARSGYTDGDYNWEGARDYAREGWDWRRRGPIA